MKSALILSGGGALGASHIGAVETLLKKGYSFDFFAGVSAGAIMASLFAMGKTPQEIEKILLDRKLFSVAFDLSFSHFGILRGDKIKTKLDEIYENKTFEDLKYPLYIGATDFKTGERVIISKGKIADAVRASLGVPVLFNPFYHESEKRWLVDGGLTQNFPLDIATEKYQGDKIIGVDVATSFYTDIDFEEKKIFKKLSTLQKTLERTFRIIFLAQQKSLPQDKRIEIICPNLQDFTTVGIFSLKKIIQAGREAVL